MCVRSLKTCVQVLQFLVPSRARITAEVESFDVARLTLSRSDRSDRSDISLNVFISSNLKSPILSAKEERSF